MTLHYLGALEDVPEAKRLSWADYINQWQDAESGRFVGPEIVRQELTSVKHDWEHVTMHLTAHALPALHLLGARPAYPLSFARRFLDRDTLRLWLDQRDWRHAWLEGNNLLFVGQFLTYMRDFEQIEEAQTSLDVYFDWLDMEQDPATGLWGTNGHCDPYAAMYGGYHQLLLYYYCGHRLPHAERTIDTVLQLQHHDGSFTPRGGGGACEDVDAVDILVNLYKRTGYRPRAIRHSLHRILEEILTHHMPDGGFVYCRGRPFTHMGILRTHSPADTSNLFATWFRVHAIALACQLLRDHSLSEIDWRFNTICSMGWHKRSPLPNPKPDPWQDCLPAPWYQIKGRLGALKRIKPVAAFRKYRRHGVLF
jgi:hypothetical protein